MSIHTWVTLIMGAFSMMIAIMALYGKGNFGQFLKPMVIAIIILAFMIIWLSWEAIYTRDEKLKEKCPSNKYAPAYIGGTDTLYIKVK